MPLPRYRRSLLLLQVQLTLRIMPQDYVLVILIITQTGICLQSVKWDMPKTILALAVAHHQTLLRYKISKVV